MNDFDNFITIHMKDRGWYGVRFNFIYRNEEEKNKFPGIWFANGTQGLEIIRLFMSEIIKRKTPGLTRILALMIDDDARNYNSNLHVIDIEPLESQKDDTQSEHNASMHNFNGTFLSDNAKFMEQWVGNGHGLLFSENIDREAKILLDKALTEAKDQNHGNSVAEESLVLLDHRKICYNLNVGGMEVVGVALDGSYYDKSIWVTTLLVNGQKRNANELYLKASNYFNKKKVEVQNYFMGQDWEGNYKSCIVTKCDELFTGVFHYIYNNSSDHLCEAWNSQNIRNTNEVILKSLQYLGIIFDFDPKPLKNELDKTPIDINIQTLYFGKACSDSESIWLPLVCYLNGFYNLEIFYRYRLVNLKPGHVIKGTNDFMKALREKPPEGCKSKLKDHFWYIKDHTTSLLKDGEICRFQPGVFGFKIIFVFERSSLLEVSEKAKDFLGITETSHNLRAAIKMLVDGGANLLVGSRKVSTNEHFIDLCFEFEMEMMR